MFRYFYKKIIVRFIYLMNFYLLVRFTPLIWCHVIKTTINDVSAQKY